MQSVDIDKAKGLLESDTLRNIVTLKMINNYPGSIKMDLLERKQKWALLSLLPTDVSEWDRKRYPNTRHVALLDGNDLGCKRHLWKDMPKAKVVLKTGDPELKEMLQRTRGVSRVDSFVSFTKRTDSAVAAQDAFIVQSDRLMPQVEGLIKENGYETEELQRYFSNGAVWFGVKNGEQIVSVCFICQNYGSVWEVAGVYTLPLFRKLGFARRSVVASIDHILSRSLIPRYQVRWNNGPSIQLALSIGLEEFLRLDHYLIGAD
jgi:hypothetical protein